MLWIKLEEGGRAFRGGMSQDSRKGYSIVSFYSGKRKFPALDPIEGYIASRAHSDVRDGHDHRDQVDHDLTDLSYDQFHKKSRP